jgi:hypothetical protein
VTGLRTGPGLTSEGGENSVGVDGVGAVVAQAGFTGFRSLLGKLWRIATAGWLRPTMSVRDGCSSSEVRGLAG